jgi:hypothetical protein
MIDRLVNSFPNFSHLQESVLDVGDLESYWQVTALNKEGQSVGSGFSKDLNSARKIAIAEFIERNFVLALKKSSERADWDLEDFPTSCGFAAGFDPVNTKIRSIGEALERWALSQWLDKGCYLEQDLSSSWAKESARLLEDFDQVYVFKKEFLYSLDNKVLPYHLSVLLAVKGLGAFIGSGVRSDYKEAKAHALLEAHRHLLISKQDRNFDIFPYNRIKYFANNSLVAVDLIQAKRTQPWTQPAIKFQRSFQNELFCVTRTIFEDWIPWERGAIDRMLY